MTPRTLRSRSRTGFTLVEVMTVVFIMSTLMSIAMLGFQRTRSVAWRHTCHENLRQIQAAKEQWANDTHALGGSRPSWSDLTGSSRYLREIPVCAAGGTYEINDLGTDPTCGYDDVDPEHALR